MINVKHIDNYDLIPISNDDDNHNYIVIIDDGKYYLKDWNSFSLNELIASEVYHLLNIDCVDYEIVSKDNKLYLMSKSFRKKDAFYYTGEELLEDYLKNSSLDKDKYDNNYYYKRNNLELIWDMLLNRYPSNDIRNNNIREVMLDLIKQYIMSIFLLDPDFHSANWILEETDNNIKLMPKFDNECAFGFDIAGMSFGVTENDFGAAIDSINTFLMMSDTIENNIFYDIYNRLNPYLVLKAIDNVNTKYDLSDFEIEKLRIYNKFVDIKYAMDRYVAERGITR